MDLLESREKSAVWKYFSFQAPRFNRIWPKRKNSNNCFLSSRWISCRPRVRCDFRVKNHPTPGRSTFRAGAKHTRWGRSAASTPEDLVFIKIHALYKSMKKTNIFYLIMNGNSSKKIARTNFIEKDKLEETIVCVYDTWSRWWTSVWDCNVERIEQILSTLCCQHWVSLRSVSSLQCLQSTRKKQSRTTVW